MRLLLPTVVLAAAAPSIAQNERPSVEPLRLEEGTVVTIDAQLDESFWERAPLLGSLTATEPVEGSEPTYPTDVRLAYDDEAFYVAIVCHDDPAEVRARQMDRDAFVSFDDVVELWFDTFNTQRFAFWFQITAGGSRGDALLADSGSSFNKSWDGIWYGKSTLTDGGWIAELKFPFKTLAFQEGESSWGFNLRRKRVANGEDARWANPRIAYQFFSLAEGGLLTGMTGMEQGRGLDITPYAKAGVAADHTMSSSFDDDFDGGLDLTWRPTPSSTVRVTTNTDFAETEVDDLRANLSRFPLFFREKRDFFLEDAGLFEFGPASGRGGGGGVTPFFSRTIGRSSDGAAVPIHAGVKYTGRLGDWNIGLLETRVDSFTTDDGPIGERSLGVVRVQKNLGGENAAGLLFTHGNPDGIGGARTYGADFRLGSTRLFGEGHSGSLWGFLVGTDNEGEPDGLTYGLKAVTRSSTIEQTAEAYVIEDGYEPALGFVRRNGVEHYRYTFEYTHRGDADDWYREVSFEFEPHYDQDLAGREDRFRLPIGWVDLQFQSEDTVSFSSEFDKERIDESFDLSDTSTINPGDYDGVAHTIQFESNERRLFKTEFSYEFGDFYDGEIERLRFEPSWIPSKHFALGLEFQDIQADLPGGDLDTQLYSTNIDWTLSPEQTFRNVLQYDTESEDLAWQARFHWILEPGQDLYFVGLFGWDRTDRNSFHRTQEEAVIKLSYTWRF